MTVIERKDHVRITNNTKHKVVGRYDGEDYEFLPGRALDAPFVVARHVFGFSLDDKMPALNRLGWLTSSDGMEAALAKLRNITFSESPPLTDEAEEFEELEEEDDTRNRLPPPSGSTAPPVSPEASGAGALPKGGASKPHGK